VLASWLAGNAINLIMPGGAAVVAAGRVRMLATSGIDTSSIVGGLAAFSLLGGGALLALPVFALPVVLVGAPVDRGLVNAAVVGAVGFVPFAAFGAIVLAYDAPLATLTYRLASYWAPLCAGPIAYGIFWIRYHRSPPRTSLAPA
jgi:hypothetical protein